MIISAEEELDLKMAIKIATHLMMSGLLGRLNSVHKT